MCPPFETNLYFNGKQNRPSFAWQGFLRPGAVFITLELLPAASPERREPGSIELAPEHQTTLRQWLPADEAGMQQATA